jgi:hypothetical protein
MLILVESKLDSILEPKELIYQMNVVPEKKLSVCLLKQMNVALIEEHIVHQRHKYFLDTRKHQPSYFILGDIFCRIQIDPLNV